MENLPRTRRGRETRERILRAASELIAERGVAAVSLDDVRERAGASKSQIYLYFADRDALLAEVAGQIADEVMALQADALAGFDTMDGIRAYLDGAVALQVAREAHGGCPIGALAGQLAEHDERARLALADGFDRWEAGLRDGLTAMARRGELAEDVDVERLANQCLALIQGGLLLTQVRRDPDQLRTAADAVLALVRDAGAPDRALAAH